MKIAMLIAFAAFAFPAAAADDTTARMRAGPNSSTEGGASLGQTGVRSNAGDTARRDSTGEVAIRPPRDREAKPRPKAREPRRTERE